jgi:hypothetical protein
VTHFGPILDPLTHESFGDIALQYRFKISKKSMPYVVFGDAVATPNNCLVFVNYHIVKRKCNKAHIVLHRLDLIWYAL